MNYEEMSDFEIEQLVANHQGIFWHVKPRNSPTGEWLYSDNYELCDAASGQYAIELPKYCNNPSDAWPIIAGMIANGCVVQILQAGVIVTLQGGGRIQFMDKNPLRAAMIVFLMMQEQAK